MTPDVNVLVAATRADYPSHALANQWLNDAVDAATAARPLTFLPLVVVGYVRIVTNRRFSATPTPLSEALATVGQLLAAPHVRIATPHDEWPRFVEISLQHELAGDVMTDAWIAASVLELNEHLVTFDRGFRKLLPAKHLTVLKPTT